MKTPPLTNEPAKARPLNLPAAAVKKIAPGEATAGVRKPASDATRPATGQKPNSN